MCLWFLLQAQCKHVLGRLLERDRQQSLTNQTTSCQTSMLDCLLRETIKKTVLYITFRDKSKAICGEVPRDIHHNHCMRQDQDSFNYGHLNNNATNLAENVAAISFIIWVTSDRSVLTCDALSVREKNKVRICDKHNRLVTIHRIH